MPIQSNSLAEMVELARILGSHSVNIDHLSERSIKTACEVIHRVGGIELVLWNTTQENSSFRLSQVKTWIGEYNELRLLSIRPKVIDTYSMPSGIKRSSTPTGWAAYGKIFNNPEYSCVLDSIPNWGLMQQIFDRTCELADNFQTPYIIPWISLGYGRKPDGKNEITDVIEWGYDVALDEWAGWEMNSRMCGDQYPRYPKWNRAPYIIIERCRLDEHLFNYLKGATRV